MLIHNYYLTYFKLTYTDDCGHSVVNVRWKFVHIFLVRSSSKVCCKRGEGHSFAELLLRNFRLFLNSLCLCFREIRSLLYLSCQLCSVAFLIAHPVLDSLSGPLCGKCETLPALLVLSLPSDFAMCDVARACWLDPNICPWLHGNICCTLLEGFLRCFPLEVFVSLMCSNRLPLCLWAVVLLVSNFCSHLM